MRIRLMITGAGGFLGSRLTEYYSGLPDYEAVGVSHRELDITDSLAVNAFFQAVRPDIVLHCGAVSDTGACERDPALSRRINVEGTANVARACRNSGARMVFMSSDQIYSASDSLEPNREGCELRPSNVYGRDKKLAEEAMFACLGEAVALRLTWMYDYPWSGRPGRAGLLENVLAAARENKTAAFPIHDYRGITCVWEVVRHMEKAMELPPGVYNFGSENRLNAFETAILFLRTATGMANTDGIIKQDTERFAGRPRNLTIDTSKIKGYGICFADTEEGIRLCCLEHDKSKAEQSYPKGIPQCRPSGRALSDKA